MKKKARNPFAGPTLHEIGEDGLIARIARLAGGPARSAQARLRRAGCDVILGIGDDTALVRTGGAQAPVEAITTDLLVGGTHFLPDHPPGDLGWKALAVNLSDLAAVGAWPAWFVVSLGVPARTPVA